MTKMTGRKFLWADASFAIILGMVIFLLIFPLPPMLLDILLVVSISAGFLILLLTIYLDRPLDFSSFPTILLVMTLFRLALNVASTKLILLEGQAGSVIDSFGNFVIGGNYIVGTVIFLILVMIQFKVITNGAGRIAEVSARFTLDALPGKQMSIDADLNSGLIDENEAQERRKELNDEAAFYGSMDGASKFVKGDVVAGLIITAINIIGGLAIGIFQQDMLAADALKTYTVLTIGDGLVSQIPSLVVSVASGILVTRSTDKGGMGSHLTAELFSNPIPLVICSVLLSIIAVMPGLPFFPFAFMATICFLISRFIVNRERKEEKTVQENNNNMLSGGGGTKSLTGNADSANQPNSTENKPGTINPMALEIGFSLVPLVDQSQEGDLIERIGMIREQILEELGFRIPPISVNDNIELGNNEYRILIRGLEKARGVVHAGSHMAINPGDVSEQIEGIRTQDPAFGFDAIWINPERVDSAESAGYTVVDAASVITTHLTKIVKESAEDLISRQDVSNMIDVVKETDEAVVGELIPDLLSVGVVHRVLQGLLREAVPIHDLPIILEVLSDYAEQTKEPFVLSEFCRQALSGHITSRFIAEDKTLYALSIHPEVEEEFQNSIQQGSNGLAALNMSPERANQIVNRIYELHENISQTYDSDIVLLVSPLIRIHLQQLTCRKIPNLPVISYAEVSDEIPVEVLGTVKLTNDEKEAA